MLKALLSKEILCEWRSFHQFAGLLSFMLAVAYLVYFFGGEVNPKFWNLMYWIIYLFLVFFSATKSFEEDNNRFKIFTNQLVSIKWVFISKALYQLIQCVIFGLVLYLIMNMLIPQKTSGTFAMDTYFIFNEFWNGRFKYVYRFYCEQRPDKASINGSY